MSGEWIKTACGFCVAGCGMNVYVKDEKPVHLEGMKEHPVNHGRLCPKGANAIEYSRHRNRIKFPMKQVDGEWYRITWDEALTTITAKLLEVKRIYGPESLAVCAGMAVLLSGSAGKGLMRRFCDVYGTPNYYSVDSMCFNPHLMAYVSTFGNFPVPDIDHAKNLILWGTNPMASQPMKARRIAAAQKDGAKVVVIDPKETGSAKKADHYLAIRPGTDCDLALGLLHVIIKEKLYDPDFVTNWVVGFDELSQHVAQFNPKHVSEVTGIAEGAIEDLARMYAGIRPACIIQGTMSLDQSANGFQTARAIAILQAITGNIDIPGGFVSPPLLRINPMRLPAKVQAKAIGEYLYPLAYRIWDRPIGEGQGMVLYDALLTGQPYPVKAMIVQGSNPLLSWPNSKRLEKGLRNLDFLVVSSVFMSETAQLADIVLPAATFLEKDDIMEIYRSESAIPYTMLRKKISEFEEAKPDAEFWLQLARHMGYEEYFPWQNVPEVIDHLLEPTGLSASEMADGQYYGETLYNRYKTRGFHTPSGKVELYSKTMEAMGYPPLPTTNRNATNKLGKGDYPIILTTGARTLGYLHSQMRDIPTLHQMNPEPLAELHSDTAEEYGIIDGDLIKVENETGSIEVGTKITESIMPGIISLPHGWNKANVNILTPEQPGDTISGAPTLKCTNCRIEKVEYCHSNTGADRQKKDCADYALATPGHS